MGDSPSDAGVDNNVISRAGTVTFNNIVDPQQFPVSALDKFFFREDGDPVDELKIIDDLDIVLGFPNCPRLQVKGDVDSIYAQDSNFKNLLECFKNAEMLTMNSVIKAERKMWNSRFYLDTTSLREPPTVWKGSLDKVSLDKFPSIEIGQLSIGLHRPMQIFLVNLSVTRICKDHMFTKTQIAVVNACMNYARYLSREECNLDKDLEVLAKDFSDVSGSKAYYGNISKLGATADWNELAREQMLIFAGKFHEALDIIASEDEEETFAFERQDWHHVKSEPRFFPSREEMKSVAADLKKASLFVASLSGIKRYFNTRDYSSLIKKSADWRECFQNVLEENEQRIVDEANEFLGPDDEEFTIRGEGDKNVNLKDIDSDFECYHDIFKPLWSDMISMMIKIEMKKISSKLHLKMIELFGIRERTNCIHFDIGFEFRTRPSNRRPYSDSLLLNVDKLFPIMLDLSKEQR